MKHYRLFANNLEIGGCSDKGEAIRMAQNYAKDNHCEVKIRLGNIIIQTIKYK